MACSRFQIFNDSEKENAHPNNRLNKEENEGRNTALFNISNVDLRNVNISKAIQGIKTSKTASKLKLARPLIGFTIFEDEELNLIEKHTSATGKEVTAEVTTKEDSIEASIPNPDNLVSGSVKKYTASPANKLGALPDIFDDSVYEIGLTLDYFRETEKLRRPSPNYMLYQRNIDKKARSELIEWMTNISHLFEQDPKAIYLAVWYIDRFLSSLSIDNKNLHLLGMAAFHIASKFGESCLLTIESMIVATNGMYTRKQILQMENYLLKNLTFNLSTPTIYVFLETYGGICEISETIKCLSFLLSELTILEPETYLKYLPSKIAAACLTTAQYITGISIWSTELETITTYKVTDFKQIVLDLSCSHQSFKNQGINYFLNKKYDSPDNATVARIEPRPITSEQFDIIAQAYQKINDVS